MGSDSKSNGRCGGDVTTGGAGNVQIPASAKKVVQNLREAVNSNCTDSEIYAVLKECGMDPNDAVQRLLSQDTFHEVKSKRERRKEMKETQESKTRAINSISNRSARVGNELVGGRIGWAQVGSNEIGKSAREHENGFSSTSASHLTGKDLIGDQSMQSAASNGESSKQPVEAACSVNSSVVQSSSGLKSSWFQASPGHVSMADVVRMGTSYDKGSHCSSETSENPHLIVQPSSATCYATIFTSSTSSMLHPDVQCESLDAVHQLNKVSGQHGLGNDWPVTAHITANSGPPIEDISNTHSAIGAEMCTKQPSRDRYSFSSNHQLDESWLPEGDTLGDHLSMSSQSSSLQLMTKGARGFSSGDDDSQEVHDRSSKMYGQNQPASSPNYVSGSVGSTIVNFQQLSLQKSATKAVPEEDHGVVLPNNVQALAADCSHLSFGTYKSGQSALTRPLTSSPLTIGLDASAATNSLPGLRLDSRDPVYQGEEQVSFTYDTHGVIAGARNYGSVNLTGRELERQEVPEVGIHKQDINLSSIPASYDGIQHILSVASSHDLPRIPLYEGENRFGFTYATHGASVDTSKYMAKQEVEKQDNPRVQDHEEDVTLSSAPTTRSESIHQRSSRASFVIDSNARNVPPMLNEMVRRSGTSNMSQPSSYVAGTTLAMEPAYQRSSMMNSFSQNGYSTMLQSNLLTPSALHQAYADGNTFHESLMAPKYSYLKRQSVADSNNAQFPGSYSLGYQGYGNSNDATGSFLQNLTPSLSGTQVGYGAQLKDNFNMLQPNEFIDRWGYPHDSRNISSVPDTAAAYYNLLRQGQQMSRYHQVQQQPLQQQYSTLGYSSIHDSHTGIIQEPQQPSFSNLILASSREQPSSEQHPQIWPRRY